MVNDSFLAFKALVLVIYLMTFSFMHLLQWPSGHMVLPWWTYIYSSGSFTCCSALEAVNLALAWMDAFHSSSFRPSSQGHLFHPGRWHSKSHIPERIFIAASKSNIILSSCDWHVAQRDFLIAFLRRFTSCYRCQFCSFFKCNSHQAFDKSFNLLLYFFPHEGQKIFYGPISGASWVR